jgi:tight adherence protein C
VNIPLKEWDAKVRAWNDRRKRARLIASALPEALDLLCLVMQAGLDFQVALKHYLEKGPGGPLKEELETVFHEIQLGISRVQALKNLCGRAPDPDLKETARALLHGLELGASLTPLLRTQAQALRRQRAFRVEKKAALAPLQLLFPLIVFIFPTIFMVLLGPLAIRVYSGGLP